MPGQEILAMLLGQMRQAILGVIELIGLGRWTRSRSAFDVLMLASRFLHPQEGERRVGVKSEARTEG